MRVNGQQVARNWAQFESQLPQGKIEPVSVKVEKNDTKIEGFPVFKKLVELSGIDKTPDEVIDELGFEKMVNSKGEEKYWDSSNNILDDWFGLCYKFLTRNYHRRWAYVKVGDREIYGQVGVNSRRFHMMTSEGILTMPSIFIADQLSGENKYVFFPMSALLSDGEQALFELYRTANITDESAAIEREIMRQLERLAVARRQKSSIVDTNGQFAEIEQMCKDSGVVKKLFVEDGKLGLEFDWRTVMDTDGEYKGMVLPPLKLLIDLRNYTVRANRCYHPHIMGDYSLCMGGRLTELVQKCITERDLKTLVGGMIDFGNSWTSSDAGNSDRHPADCIRRYYNDNGANWPELPVDLEDIWDTLDSKGYDKYELGEAFASLVN